MRHFIYFLNTASYKREEVKLASTAKGRKMHRFDALLSLEKGEKFCCSTTYSNNFCGGESRKP